MAKSRRRKKADHVADEKEATHRAINKIKKGLNWRITIKKGEGRCRILSDQRERVHAIYLGRQDPTNGLDLLHELCHAHFHEHSHPSFSTLIFATGTDKQQYFDTIHAINLARDWFVEDFEHSLVPIPFEREIKDLTANLLQLRYHTHQGGVSYLCEEALLIAQSKRYLQQSIPADGALADMVCTILETDPSQPSIESLVALINKLLHVQKEIVGRTLHVELVYEGECEMWKINEGAPMPMDSPRD